ncbi:MAG: hypothetical protein JST80_00740 [Bdellovibrionales bacterium]|nr:hypothetical protein [Bdellovibrionales bacterium]
MNPHQLKLKDRADYLLQEWVNVNSHAENHAGVGRILAHVADEADALGMKSEWITHEKLGKEGSAALVINLPGTVPTEKTITFIARADTAFPEDSGFQLITWTTGRHRAIGPGVLDNKGGILVGLLALEKISKLKVRRYQVQMLVLPGESEEAPDGYKEFLRTAGEKSNLVIGLGPAQPDGSIFQYTPTTDPNAEQAAKIAQKLIELHEKKNVKVLSPNFVSYCDDLFRPEIVVFDGFGPVGTAPGTLQETVEMSSIFSRADIVYDLIQNLVS